MSGSSTLDPRRQLGNRGEELAAHLLAAAGLTLITRNWRCAEGELDIVAHEAAMDWTQGGAMVTWLVLVEVRIRRGDHYGTARQSITARKAAKLRVVAAAYVQSVAWRGPWRIDVVAIQLDGAGRLLTQEHLRHAVTG